MANKVLGILIILAATILSLVAFKDHILSSLNKSCMQMSPAQQLSKLIHDDFEILSKNGQLPKEWSSLSTIEIHMNSQLAKALLGNLRPSFNQTKDGTHFLELEFMDLPDETNPGIIIQGSLFEIKSKNKIFEIGRTYTMSDLNKNNQSSPESNLKPATQ